MPSSDPNWSEPTWIGWKTDPIQEQMDSNSTLAEEERERVTSRGSGARDSNNTGARGSTWAAKSWQCWDLVLLLLLLLIWPNESDVDKPLRGESEAVEGRNGSEADEQCWRLILTNWCSSTSNLRRSLASPLNWDRDRERGRWEGSVGEQWA